VTQTMYTQVSKCKNKIKRSKEKKIYCKQMSKCHNVSLCTTNMCKEQKKLP
jgi:hypothetical protein